MEIRIQNFRRINNAELTIAPIALVAGMNEAGKTSLQQAVRAALTRWGMPVQGLNKKDSKLVLRKGESRAHIEIVGDEGQVSVRWPKCDVLEDGERPPFAGIIASGALSLFDLSIADRAEYLNGILNAEPSLKDLTEAFEAIGLNETASGRAWSVITEDGWDAAHEQAKTHGAKLKGRWEQLTGEKYGPKKAEGWRPGDVPEDATEDALQADIDASQSVLDDAIRAEARNAVDLEVLQEQATADAKVDLDALDQAFRDANAAHQRAEVALSAMQEKSKAGKSFPKADCPHCGESIEIRGSGILAIPDPNAVKDEPEPTTTAGIEAAREHAMKAQETLNTARNAYNEGENLRKTADAARAKLNTENLEQVNDIGQAPPDVAKARYDLEQAQRALVDFKKIADATTFHRQISLAGKTVEVLAPDGLRRRVVSRSIKPLNDRMAELAKIAKWKPAYIDEAMDVTYGEYPYGLVSESAQMRARLLLQIAVAEIDGSDCVLIDRADMLDQSGRNGLFAILSKTSIPGALVCMTINKAELVPDLHAAKLGRSYWISDGSLTPIEPRQMAKVA